MQYFTCRQNVRETGLGFEPELTEIDPSAADFPADNPLNDWLETDHLTLIDRPHITAHGTIGCQLYAHEETGQTSLVGLAQ